MFKALAILLFFPSVTFGALAAEVFPWGIVFVLFFLRRISAQFLFLVSLMLASCLYTTYALVFHGDVLETDIVRSLAAYLNVILLAQALLILGRDRAIQMCKISQGVFWGLILLGCLQTVGSEVLGSVIRLLVPRGEGSALIESNRGVTLLATEPARAGIELTLVYLMGRLGSGHDRTWLVRDLFLIVFLALIIKSASALGFALGAFAIIYFKFKLSIGTILSAALFAVSSFIFVTFILPDLGGRVGELASVVGSMELNSEVLFYIANESGNRLLALYSFFVSGILNPFGYGIGSWPYSSMLAVEQSGLDYRDFRFFDVRGEGDLIAFRGPGLVSNLMLDMGVVGVLIAFSLFYKGMKKYGEFGEQSKKAFLIFIFKIFLFGSPGNPIVFVFLISVFLVSAPNKIEQHYKV